MQQPLGAFRGRPALRQSSQQADRDQSPLVQIVVATPVWDVEKHDGAVVDAIRAAALFFLAVLLR